MNDEMKTIERLRVELGAWRSRLEHARVQANLGRKEAQDRLRDLGERLTPAFQEARQRLERIASSGAGEARTLGKSLLAGWEELRRTHRELSREKHADESPKPLREDRQPP